MSFLVAVALTLTPAAPAPDLLPEASKALDQIAVYVHDQERANIEATMAELAVEFGEWLKQITPPPPPPTPSPTLPRAALSAPAGGGVPASSSGGGGAHSDAWWQGVAVCEQGGRNSPYYGYFSVMDGSAGGGKSWGEQVAIVNGIISRYGDSAWAQACVNAGYRASPSG